MSKHNKVTGLSRREFLVGLGAGAGLLILKPAIGWAAGSAPQKGFSFIIVSDTHLGYKGKDSAAKLWQKTAAEIGKSDADFVLHLGDIVDGGNAEQYPIYKQARDASGKTFYEVPGNHDPAELFAQHIRKDIDTSFDHNGVRFILFKNTKPEQKAHDGMITDQQIAWMDKLCTEAAAKKMGVIFGSHVPCHTNKSPDRGWYVKPEAGQKKFYEMLAKHKANVIAVLHGHFHNGIHGWQDNGVEEVVLPSALYNKKRNTQGSGMGYTLEEFKPGYTLVKLTKSELTLTYVVTGAAKSVSKTYSLSGKLS